MLPVVRALLPDLMGTARTVDHAPSRSQTGVSPKAWAPEDAVVAALCWLVPSSALTRCGESLGQTPGHRVSARYDQATSGGGRGACERADELTNQHSGRWGLRLVEARPA